MSQYLNSTIRRFYNCCGAVELGGFFFSSIPYTDYIISDDSDRTNKQRAHTVIRKARERAAESVTEVAGSEYKHTRPIIVTLTTKDPAQKAVRAALLEIEDAEMIMKWHNRGYSTSDEYAPQHIIEMWLIRNDVPYSK